MSFLDYPTIVQRHQRALENIKTKWSEKNLLEQPESKPVDTLSWLYELVMGPTPAPINEHQDKLNDQSNKIQTLSGLEFMIFENKFILTLLDKLTQNLDGYAKQEINHFLEKILRQCHTEKNQIDIHQFIQLLNLQLKTKNNDLQKLQQDLKLWGEIYFYSSLTLMIALPILATILFGTMPIELFCMLCGVLFISIQMLSFALEDYMFSELEAAHLYLALIAVSLLTPLFLGTNAFLFSLISLCFIPLQHGEKLIEQSRFLEHTSTINKENLYEKFENSFFSPRLSTQQDPDIQSPADEVQTEFERLSFTT